MKISIENWQQAAATIIDKVILTPQTQEIIEYLCLYFSEDPAFESATPPPFLLSETPSLKKGLLIIGPNGVGKTFAFEVFSRLYHFGFIKRYYSMTDTRAVASDVTRNGIEAIRNYVNGDRLFNELGSEPVAKSYGNPINAMYEVIFEREKKHAEKGFKTHFTSNLSSNQIAEQYDLAILSRLRGMCNIIEFNPQDSADLRGFSSRISPNINYTDFSYRWHEYFAIMSDIMNFIYDEETLPIMFNEVVTMRKNIPYLYPGIFGPYLDQVDQFIKENKNPQKLMQYAKQKPTATEETEANTSGGFKENGIGTIIKKAIENIGKG